MVLNRFLIFFIILLLSCKKKVLLDISEYQTESIYTEVLIDDTLYKGRDNYGLLRFQYKLDDSIKLSKNDYRAIFLCTELFNGFNAEINFKDCDSFSSNTTRVNDTINCSFNFKIKDDNLKQGRYQLFGKIYDHIILSNPSDTTFIRKIEREYIFKAKKDLFVK